jgi:hypothetical protein
MANLQNTYVNLGIACRLIALQGDTSMLEIDDSSYSNLIDSWEIVANEESRDGFEHPKMKAAGATATQISKMRQFLESNTDSAVAFADAGLSALAATNAQGLYILQQLGSTNYRRGQYVLRHRTNAPSRWAANVADIGVDKIYTTSQLLSEVTSSGLWVYPLPFRMQYKISSIPSPGTYSNYQWGWLKSATTETTAPNNRIDLMTEYTLELWSTIYYDPY